MTQAARFRELLRRDGMVVAPGAYDCITARLIELIHDLESGRRPMAWSNLDEMVKVAPPLTRKEMSR